MTVLMSNHKSDISKMIQDAVAAVDPFAGVVKAIEREGAILTLAEQSFNCSNGRLFVVSVGKAAVPMLNGALSVLGNLIYKGVAVTKKGQTERVEAANLKTFFAAHPVPDESSVVAADQLFGLLEKTAADDFVLFLISGGASALMTRPLLPLSAWQELSKNLLGSGCTIQEFNTVRKQLDSVKGGGLALQALPAKFATLVLSDVIGNPIDMIGSGPTVPNPQTPADALAILSRYSIDHSTAVELLGQLPSEQDRFESAFEFVGDLRIATRVAAKAAAGLGYKTTIKSTELEGEAAGVGAMAARMGKELRPGECLIFGGETTVTLSGGGIGGRNQELALAAAIELEHTDNIVVATYATDGDDGPTPAAGAIVTGQTVGLGRQKGLEAADYLAKNDSYTYFEKLGEHLIVTGQTGTNVNDLLFVLRY